jgi:hypothetical protein
MIATRFVQNYHKIINQIPSEEDEEQKKEYSYLKRSLYEKEFYLKIINLKIKYREILKTEQGKKEIKKEQIQGHS